MADLYRKSSLEKLANPEQIDRMIRITSPLSWVGLIAVLLCIIATILWAVFGTVPTTETVSGMIVSPDNAFAVYSDEAGIIEKFYLKSGDAVAAGDRIARVNLPGGEKKNIMAGSSGTLTALTAEKGSRVVAGTEIARITPHDADDQIIICYIPLAVAKRFEKGMSMSVYPMGIDAQEYGHMEAEIQCVEEYATNTGSLSYVLGSGNLVAEQFAANGPIVAAVCRLKTDDSTKSGFYWSNRSGADVIVSNGTAVTAKVVVDECAPITKLVGKLKRNLEE